MPLKELTGAGTARAEGVGEITQISARLAGEGVAAAEGVGILSPFVLRGTGLAAASGNGWLSWPAPPRVPPTLESAWFYGSTMKRELPGAGAAVAGGTGEL